MVETEIALGLTDEADGSGVPYETAIFGSSRLDTRTALRRLVAVWVVYLAPTVRVVAGQIPPERLLANDRVDIRGREGVELGTAHLDDHYQPPLE